MCLACKAGLELLLVSSDGGVHSVLSGAPHATHEEEFYRPQDGSWGSVENELLNLEVAENGKHIQLRLESSRCFRPVSMLAFGLAHS
jgi:hypothetical protein